MALLAEHGHVIKDFLAPVAVMPVVHFKAHLSVAREDIAFLGIAIPALMTVSIQRLASDVFPVGRVGMRAGGTEGPVWDVVDAVGVKVDLTPG